MAECWASNEMAEASHVSVLRKHIYDLSAPATLYKDDFPLSQEEINAAMAAAELAASTLEDGELLGAVKTAAYTPPSLFGAVSPVPSGATTANATPRSEAGCVLPEPAVAQEEEEEGDDEDADSSQHRKTRRGRRGGKKTQARREKAIAEGRPAHKPRHRQDKEGQEDLQFPIAMTIQAQAGMSLLPSSTDQVPLQYSYLPAGLLS